MTLSFQQTIGRPAVTGPARTAIGLATGHVEGGKTDWDCFKLHRACSLFADAQTTNEALLCFISG